MNIYTENNAAFILSVCYGFLPDTAAKLVDCAGNTEKRDSVVENELNAFFDDSYRLKESVFTDYAENEMSVVNIAEKYNIACLTVRRYLDSFESHYLEFSGMIETGMADIMSHPMLKSFLMRYGRWYMKKQEERMEKYNTYQDYLEGRISLRKLSKLTHMSPVSLSRI